MKIVRRLEVHFVLKYAKKLVWQFAYEDTSTIVETEYESTMNRVVSPGRRGCD